ncbi:YeiH family protein [Alloscardovia venturai]|uniref:YeiH family protein n=1 Tax=Alloscardovia venturai TaxID=1769421 RepID=A0ABW2Y6W9_9BIFI
MRRILEKTIQLAPGVAISLIIGLIAWFLGRLAPVIGGPIFAILMGMIIAVWWKDKGKASAGIGFTSKYILQTAVVLLGFGLDLAVVARTGWQSLPIIITTIAISLILAFVLRKAMNIDSNSAALIGVGSSICGGSAIAATAPVIEADDHDVAQSISVIFFFNVLAALFFPYLGHLIGMSTTSGEAFGIFAGTAVNDTSSVTATAATWDTMWNLGSATLDKAVTVKLTRTLAIIPITLILAYMNEKRKIRNGQKDAKLGFSFKRAFPLFIAWFILASLITTIALHVGAPVSAFTFLKELSKFLIIMAMAAIGLNSDIVKLVKTGGKALALGAICWIGITVMSLIVMKLMGLF